MPGVVKAFFEIFTEWSLRCRVSCSFLPQTERPVHTSHP